MDNKRLDKIKEAQKEMTLSFLMAKIHFGEYNDMKSLEEELLHQIILKLILVSITLMMQKHMEFLLKSLCLSLTLEMIWVAAGLTDLRIFVVALALLLFALIRFYMYLGWID